MIPPPRPYTSRQIALVVPTLSYFEGLAALFASVDVPVLPVVLDNWRHPTRGVAASWNEGLRRASAAGCDVAVVANDDVVLHPGAIGALAQGILTGGFALLATGSRDTGSAGYTLFAVEPARFLSLTGGFDEGFRQAYFEDDDMHYRLKLLARSSGHKAEITIEGARSTHGGSKTQLRDPNKPVVSHEQFEANRARYVRKWGCLPGHETFVRPFDGKKPMEGDEAPGSGDFPPGAGYRP